jgi:ABC-type phosphate transport system substrate-binding protein
MKALLAALTIALVAVSCAAPKQPQIVLHAGADDCCVLLMAALAEAYHREHPDVWISCTGPGSVHGLTNGHLDLIARARPLSTTNSPQAP